MKQQLLRLLTLTISLEMMMAPLTPAFAQDSKKKDFSSSINDIANTAIGTLGNAGIGLGAAGGANYNSDLSMLEQQKLPQNDQTVFNTNVLLLAFPDMKNWISKKRPQPNFNCPVLKPLNIVEPDICDPTKGGIPNDPRTMNYYREVAKNFATQYKDISNIYSDSSEAFLGSTKCMADAAVSLQNFFNDRLNQLDEVTNKMDKAHKDFMAAMKNHKDNIAMDSAMLIGEKDTAEMTKDVDPATLAEAKRQLEAKYKNSACPTVSGFRADQLGKTGLQNAYEAVDKQTRDPIGSEYTASSYGSKHAKVVAELERMSTAASAAIKNNFKEVVAAGGIQGYMSALNSKVPSNSEFGADSLLTDGNFKADTEYDADIKAINTKRNEIIATLGSRAQDLINDSSDRNAVAYEKRVTNLGNALQQSCINTYLSEKGMTPDDIAKNSKSAQKSKHAERNSSNVFDIEIKNIMSNSTLSPDEKIAKINQARKDEKRTIKLGKKFIFTQRSGETTTPASLSGTVYASDFYSAVIKQCEAEFYSTKSGKTTSEAKAVQALSKLRAEYDTLSSKQAQNFSKAFKEKFLTCSSASNGIANNTALEACSPAKFNLGSAGFCAASAQACAGNMTACSKMAKAQVDEIVKRRDATVSNYNAQVKSHVEGLKALYNNAESLMEGLMKNMESGFSSLGIAGFSLPQGLERDPKLGKLSAYSKAGIMMEDPEAGINAFKKNIALLKQQVKSYQDEFMGPSSKGNTQYGGVIGYMNQQTDLYKKVQSDASRMKDSCENAIMASRQQENEMNKALTEQLNKFGQQLPKFCKKFGRAKSDHPNAACSGVTDDLITSALEASAKLGSANATAAVAEFADVCDGYNNESNEDSSKREYSIEVMCKKLEETGKDDRCQAVLKNGKERKDKCDEVISGKDESKISYNCDDVKKDIALDFTRKFPNGPDSASKEIVKVTSEAPEFCEAADGSDYRYNPRKLMPGGNDPQMLGQQANNG